MDFSYFQPTNTELKPNGLKVQIVFIHKSCTFDVYMNPYEPNMDELMFFDGKPIALDLYKTFVEKLFLQFLDTGIRVQKTQITFTNPKVYTCVSFAKVRKANGRPKEYIVITLGLDRQVYSSRIDVVTEPYPGRWTHHLLIEKREEIDEELMSWAQEAYYFTRVKRRMRTQCIKED